MPVQYSASHHITAHLIAVRHIAAHHITSHHIPSHPIPSHPIPYRSINLIGFRKLHAEFSLLHDFQQFVHLFQCFDTRLHQCGAFGVVTELEGRTGRHATRDNMGHAYDIRHATCTCNMCTEHMRRAMYDIRYAACNIRHMTCSSTHPPSLTLSINFCICATLHSSAPELRENAGDRIARSSIPEPRHHRCHPFQCTHTHILSVSWGE